MHSFKIPISDPAEKFKKVLDTKDNNKIFFSGKFGSGKTYFLNEFFKEKKDDYQVFHLYPSSYYIEGDKDIFDLIKANILLEIFFIKKYKKDGIYTSYKDLPLEKKEELIYLIPVIGKKTKKFMYFLEKIINIFNPKNAEIKMMEDYIKFIQSDKISDFISKEIKEIKKKQEEAKETLIEQKKLKKESKTQKSILIIDDLDRLFPEHVFRILNLLSSQGHEDVAPFGFDRLIVVGDYENVRKIYHHKYGCCDFDGYMSKFYSKEIFFFYNKESVVRELENIIIDNTKLNNSNVSDGHVLCVIPSKILLDGLNCGAVIIRNLTKYNNFVVGSENHQELNEELSGACLINRIIQGLNSAFGSKEATIEMISTIQKKLHLCEKTETSILIWICKYIVEDTINLLIGDPLDYKNFNDRTMKILGTGFTIKKNIDESDSKNYTYTTDQERWFFVPDSKDDLNKLMYELLIEYLKNDGKIMVTLKPNPLVHLYS